MAKNDLVVMPRKEYEALLALKKTVEFNPNSAQKAALKRAEKNLNNAKTLSLNEFVRQLDFKN